MERKDRRGAEDEERGRVERKGRVWQRRRYGERKDRRGAEVEERGREWCGGEGGGGGIC